MYNAGEEGHLEVLPAGALIQIGALQKHERCIKKRHDYV